MKISTSSDAEQSPPVDSVPANPSRKPGVVDGGEAAGGVGSTRLPRPHIAARHRLAALASGWRSSALWKMHDAEMSDDENEATACRREAQTFEICAGNVEAWIRNYQ